MKVTALMMSFCHCKILLKIFSGFLITKWKETQTDVIPFWQKTDKTQLHLGDSLIKNSTFEKILGVIDNKLCFDQHIKNICKETKTKLRAFTRATTDMEIRKWKLLLNAQVNYCPLICMLHSRCYNNKVK